MYSTDIVGLKGRIGLVSHFRGSEEVLHASRKVRDGRKTGFTHDALEHHATGDGNLHIEFFELFLGFVAVLFAQVSE